MDLTPSSPSSSLDKDAAAANSRSTQVEWQTEAADSCTTLSPSDNHTSVRTSPSVSSPLPLAIPPNRKEKANDCFDILGSLWDAGVPHVFLLIMSFLNMESLTLAEQVSTLWRDVIDELLVWKYAIKRTVNTNALWRGLFERRRWLKCLSQEVTSSKPMNAFYRQLYQRASRDIHSLEANWRSGHYTLTKIHTGSAVLCIQYDSEKIVSGHGDMTIKIWDRRTLQLNSTLVGHDSFVWCLQFNEKVVISGSDDSSVKVWDIQTGHMVNDLLHHKNSGIFAGVKSLKFNSELLITGSHDTTVAVWDIKSPTDITLRMVLKGHEGIVFAVDLTDSFIISGSSDRTIKVWDISTGGLLHTLLHSSLVWSVCGRGSFIISGCDGGMIRMWDLFTAASLREWRGHEDIVCCIATDDKKILTASCDSTVKVWSVSAALELISSTDSLCITTLKEHTALGLTGVQFDDFEVISCSEDQTICIHDFLGPNPVDLISLQVIN